MAKTKPPITDQLARQLSKRPVKGRPAQGNGFVWQGGTTPRQVGAASAFAGESKRLYYGSK